MDNTRRLDSPYERKLIRKGMDALNHVSKHVSLLFLAVLASLFLNAPVAHSALEISKLSNGEYLGRYSYYLIDTTGELSFRNVARLSPNDWTANDNDILALGYSTDVVWTKLTLENKGLQHDGFFEIAYPVLDHLDVILDYGNHIKTYQMGDLLPFNERPVTHRNFVVPFQLNSDQQVDIYVRVNTSTSIQLPLRFWSEQAFFASEQNKLVWQGLYIGSMIVMVFYNLCLFYFIRKKQYIFFAMAFGAFALFQSSLNGMNYQYLWPNSPDLNDHALPLFLGLVLAAECLFVSAFLNLKNQSPKIAKILSFSAIFTGVTIFISLFVPYRWSIMTLIILAMPINALAFAVGVKQWVLGNKAAQLYTIAWFGTLAGSFVLALNKLGLFEPSFFTEHALQIGTAISVIWLTFALGEYISQQNLARQQAKEEALNSALALAKERKAKLRARESALIIQKRANETLETKVKQRTEELHQAMKDLEKANSRLKHLSDTDELTGTYNRRHFNFKLLGEFKRAQRTTSPISVVIVDIDHFKQVNDTYGHLTGDEALKAIAQLLQDQINRPGDIIARFGGEEFIMLLPDTPIKGAQHVANSVREAVEKTPFLLNDEALRLTVSIGVASVLPSYSDNQLTLIADADAALYDAKNSGRNRVCSAKPMAPQVLSMPKKA